MGKNKKTFVLGILILVGGLVTAAIAIIKLMGLGYAQGEVVGEFTYDDGTPVVLVSIEVDGKQYMVTVPEKSWNGSAAYDKRSPSRYVNAGKLKLELFTLALPELVLGLTLILSNRKAFSGAKDKDSPDDDGVEKE